jgi:hypothetical protein
MNLQTQGDNSMHKGCSIGALPVSYLGTSTRTLHQKCTEHQCLLSQRHSHYEPQIACHYWFRLTPRVPMSMIDKDTAEQDYDDDDYIDWENY